MLLCITAHIYYEWAVTIGFENSLGGINLYLPFTNIKKKIKLILLKIVTVLYSIIMSGYIMVNRFT